VIRYHEPLSLDCAHRLADAAPGEVWIVEPLSNDVRIKPGAIDVWISAGTAGPVEPAPAAAPEPPPASAPAPAPAPASAPVPTRGASGPI
jgi:hypothetical protein